jgi:hypothetical protein
MAQRLLNEGDWLQSRLFGLVSLAPALTEVSLAPGFNRVALNGNPPSPNRFNGFSVDTVSGTSQRRGAIHVPDIWSH